MEQSDTEIFLSTPSARRATQTAGLFPQSADNFYPRPPRGGRPPPPLCGLVGVKISIHALREEGDVSPYRGDQQHAISIHALREEGDVMEMQPAFWQLLFLSTPSARRATEVCGADRRICEISIHALREEGDRTRSTATSPRSYFYPRPPRGGRPGNNTKHLIVKLFLSTPSARRATDRRAGNRKPDFISIHALREEGDPPAPTKKGEFVYFYPRPPRGGRLIHKLLVPVDLKFLSTPSARRATLVSVPGEDDEEFLSTPSARRATSRAHHAARRLPISIHALREEGDAVQYAACNAL